MYMHWGSNLENKTRNNSLDKVKLIGFWSFGLSIYWLILRFISSTFITIGFPRIPPEMRSYPIWPLAISGLLIGLVIGTVIGHITISFFDNLFYESRKDKADNLFFQSVVFGLILSLAETLGVVSNIFLGTSSFIQGFGSFFDIQTWLPSILNNLIAVLLSMIAGFLIGLLLHSINKHANNLPSISFASIFSFAFFVGALFDRLAQVFFSRFRWYITSLPINGTYFILNSIGSFVFGVVVTMFFIAVIPSFMKQETA